MSETATMTEPIIGMIVVWIEPEKSPDPEFVQKLIEHYGQYEMTVMSKNHQNDHWMVTLSRDNSLLRGKLLDNTIALFCWGYLRPALDL